MKPISATRLRAADATVTVVSNTASVPEWSRRYFGPWWNAFDVPAAGGCTGPVVTADVNPGRYAQLATGVSGAPHEDTVYAKALTRLATDEHGTIRAVAPSEELAYVSEPATGRLAVIGLDAEPVALAAARLARDVVRGQLLRSGWTLLHASAVVRGGKTVLTFGSKGAGKTTTALALAGLGWELLANDRVFVRPGANGTLKVLPWPSAAAIGLGLLDALDWFDVVRQRLRAGERLHPTQHPDVTNALLTGRREALWEPGGKRERKVQVFPDQFASWFNITLASGGHAEALLFPQIRPDATPAIAERPRTLSDADFMSGTTEDRYPDVFGLLQIDGGGTAEARATVAEQLAKLPHHSVHLGHNLQANAAFLDRLLRQ
ncbi:hypothetical protein [Streptomyces graminilatus]|uniref:hypothetical protein n=1 Tax=Streptomyces graminilatus TaxID=1464070 RepID=UPI0006E36538|nr:hypothetical protein [Streptomyces graminilatus]